MSTEKKNKGGRPRIYEPDAELITTGVRMPVSLYAVARDYAKAGNISLSDLMRRAIVAYIPDMVEAVAGRELIQ